MICVMLASVFFYFTDVAKAQSNTENENIKIEITDGYRFKTQPKTTNGSTKDVFIPNLKKLQIKVTGADNVTINGKKADEGKAEIDYQDETEKLIQIIAQSGEEAPYITYLKLRPSEIKNQTPIYKIDVDGGTLKASMKSDRIFPKKNDSITWDRNDAYFIEIPKDSASDKNHKISISPKDGEFEVMVGSKKQFKKKIYYYKTKPSSDGLSTTVTSVVLHNVEYTEKNLTLSLAGIGKVPPEKVCRNIPYIHDFKPFAGMNYYAIDASFVKNGKSESCFFFFYEKPDNVANKTALIETLSKAPKSGHYINGDRYNGKSYSKKGYWNEYKEVLNQAEKINDGVLVSQKDVDDINLKLNESIKNLIPEDRINPTNLYEAIQKWNGKYLSQGDINHYNDAKHWSRATWNAFYTARKNAEEMLSSLYDENGNPTDANKASENTKVEKLIETLEKSGNALKEAPLAGIDEIPSRNYTEGIKLYARLYDPNKLKESDYTAGSWKKYKEAYANAMDVLKKYPTYDPNMARENILKDQADAFIDFSKACYGLTENKDTISVKLSCIDNCSIRNGNEKPDTVTKTVKLQKLIAL